MLMLFNKKKNPHEASCFICHIIIAILLFLSTIAAVLGVIMAHYDPRQMTLVFGSNADSLSLIAFVLCVTLWMKSMKSCMSGCEACGTMGKK